MKVARVTRKGEGRTGYYAKFEELEGIKDEIECSEVGDEIHIKIVEMSLEKYGEFPEFQGW